MPDEKAKTHDEIRAEDAKDPLMVEQYINQFGELEIKIVKKSQSTDPNANPLLVPKSEQ